MQLNELEEFHQHAYEEAKLYKERTKFWHDKRVLKRKFMPRQKVLLYNSILRLFPRKLRSRWLRPFIAVKVQPYGIIEIQDGDQRFKMNMQRLKEYNDGALNALKTIITFKEPTDKF